MAAGHFYPLPPVFIGGRQPYAPKQGLPQSGPTPEAPPVRSFAQFASILDTWRVAPPTFIGGAQAFAPRLGLVPETVAVTGQPPFTRQSLGIVQSWWVQAPITTISLSSIAPLLATADQPPPKTALFLSILEAWRPSQYALPRQVAIASILATPPTIDAPPIRSYAAQIAIREAWNFPPPPAQGFTGIVPLLPAPVAPDNPPQTTHVRMMSIIRQYDLEQWWPLPQFVKAEAISASGVEPPIEEPSTGGGGGKPRKRQIVELDDDDVIVAVIKAFMATRDKRELH